MTFENSKSFSPRLRAAFAGLVVLGMSACTAPTPGAEFNDPFEATNRSVHAFNVGLDRNVLRPVGRATTAVPSEVLVPVSNFADNIALPSMIVNGLLQADFRGSANNTLRLLLNSTIGLGGLLDPADDIGLNEESTGFGETLAVWGVQEGAYVELPVLGPSTERDAVGRIVDLVFDPLAQVGAPYKPAYGAAARVADIAITRGEFMDTLDSILYESADSYAQSRLLYLQNRRFQLGQEAPVETQIDPFSDDLSLEGFE